MQTHHEPLIRVTFNSVRFQAKICVYDNQCTIGDIEMYITGDIEMYITADIWTPCIQYRGITLTNETATFKQKSFYSLWSKEYYIHNEHVVIDLFSLYKFSTVIEIDDTHVKMINDKGEIERVNHLKFVKMNDTVNQKLTEFVDRFYNERSELTHRVYEMLGTEGKTRDVYRAIKEIEEASEGVK